MSRNLAMAAAMAGLIAKVFSGEELPMRQRRMKYAAVPRSRNGPDRGRRMADIRRAKKLKNVRRFKRSLRGRG